ncbi:16S rRNA (guanine(527)-N(7))-methyltransferase RsmG [Aliiglaciecola sp. LCG003]|uniref:16S rRNA (guanine(527)-N(7))-methyltransferase RsmG n=1 Tax=Aliiglaciecola sp. LCG003 TaxID=3053655 RepID=UPI0025748628|nr:16S rRNA (guanine(527)-N(7))-methyltransferase RsmG [Aliiglaciecola sp. LCG003]WJG09446.1 16S rRNA (guanine(527)-N(7))-methyltransferase RsmG [Aliiglaciecola sp. LCG003]
MSELKTSLLAAFDHAVAPLELEVSEQQRQLLVDFVLMMHKWNKAYNLTSVRDPQQMLIKHIVDSIVVAPHLTRTHYIDVGTGPGLPGIPLSIMHPDKHFVLLDSLGKRVRFMKQASFELGLKNIQPVQSRVEQYNSEIALDGVLSRAFASIKDMLHWCQHLVDSTGEFIALKGQYPEHEIALLPEGFEVVESIPLTIPTLEGQRHLIRIRKLA